MSPSYISVAIAIAGAFAARHVWRSLWCISLRRSYTVTRQTKEGQTISHKVLPLSDDEINRFAEQQMNAEFQRRSRLGLAHFEKRPKRAFPDRPP